MPTSTNTGTRNKKTKKPQNAKKSHLAPSPEEIALRAYYIWEQSGQEHGHDLQDWLEAESQLSRAPRAP